MNREQLACAILTEYESRLPPGQQHTLGARVEAMLHTVDALKLAVVVAPATPASFEKMFPNAIYPFPPMFIGGSGGSAPREVCLQPTPTEGDSGHRK